MLLLSKNCNSFQGLVLELCIHVSTFYQSQISPPLTCFTPTLSIQQRTTSLNRQKITGDAIFLPATSIISRSEFRPFYKVLQVVVAMAVQARTSLPGTTEPGRTGNKFVQNPVPVTRVFGLERRGLESNAWPADSLRRTRILFWPVWAQSLFGNFQESEGNTECTN